MVTINYLGICARAGPPMPPASPGVVTSNLTTLVVSWTAPWSFPVKNYILRMTDASSSELVRTWVTNATQALVTKTWQSECKLVVFTVEAITDVGHSGASQPTMAGFPISKCMWVGVCCIVCTSVSLLRVVLQCIWSLIH